MMCANVLERVALAVGAKRELCGPGDLLVSHHDGLALKRVEAIAALRHDLEALVALLEAQHHAAVGVGVR